MGKSEGKNGERKEKDKHYFFFLTERNKSEAKTWDTLLFSVDGLDV